MTEYAICTSVSYVNVGRQPHMRFETQDHGAVDVSNGVNATPSRALRLLAYLGARPSRLDEAEGKRFPVQKIDGEWYPTDEAMEVGQDLLREADWYWRDVESIKEANSPDPEEVDV